jgi:hypothetical protein
MEDTKMIELRKSRVLRIIPLILILVLFCPFTYGKVIYVDDDAAGANDGSSWADAYNYLQDALADANTAEKPVEILVAQGIYTPDRGSGFTLGNKVAKFRLLNDVSIRGGFAGAGSVDPDARNIKAYETILSGDLSGDDAVVTNPNGLSGEPTRAENSDNIVDGSDTDETAVLEGIIITAGSTGMRNWYGNPTIVSCTFTNSRRGMDNRDSNPRLTKCTFKGHWLKAIGQHGGILTLSDCLFTGNTGTSVDAGFGAELILQKCAFLDNISREAIDFHGENLRLYNCEFRNNIGGSVAGVTTWIDREFIVDNCTFAGNIGAGIDHHGNGRIVVSNCVFAGNMGGFFSNGINSWSPYTTIKNCTFSGNSSAKAMHGGSALNLIRGGKVSNCIVWDNGSPAVENGGQEIYINYCNIQDGWPGEGNIDVDPNFVQPGYWDQNSTQQHANDDFWVEGDYHLRSQAGRWDRQSQIWMQDDVTSPCIDAGDPNGPIGVEPFPNGGIVNMGAYGASNYASKTYFGKPVCETIIAGDINGDCVVDFDDLMIMLSHWMISGEDLVDKPPTVRLIEPQDGDRIPWPGPTTFRAEASDIDGQVDEITFRVRYKKDNKTRTLGFGDSDGSDGWEREFTWPGDADFGMWTVWAEATDNEGAIGFSPEIAITLYRP